MMRKVVVYEELWQQTWGVDEMGQKERFGSAWRAQWCLQPEGLRCSGNHGRLDHSEVEHSSPSELGALRTAKLGYYRTRT
jgi:hypothetical protein